MIEAVHRVWIVKKWQIFSAWNIWLKSLKYRQQNVIWSSGKQSLLFLLFHLFKITKFPTLFNWFVDRKINFVEIQKIFFFFQQRQDNTGNLSKFGLMFLKNKLAKKKPIIQKVFFKSQQINLLRRTKTNPSSNDGK
jgi:hypothetical protein